MSNDDLFAPPVGYTPPVLTAQVVSADGYVMEYAADLAEAEATAERWNEQPDARQRAHSGAYPFRAEPRS